MSEEQRTMRIPPVLSAEAGSALAHATADLVESARPLGLYIAQLPESWEREAAAQYFNTAMLWAHQALSRATTGRVLVAAANALPK